MDNTQNNVTTGNRGKETDVVERGVRKFQIWK